jgi:prolyl-tRNA editing enzyme YbaK/EbsC (Cys-tRNA(Pro) deacylase)
VKTSAKAVQLALEAAGLDCQVQELPESTRSAKEAAAAIGCRVPEIVKSLIFRGANSGKIVLVLAAGNNRVDEIKIGNVIDEPIEKASAAFVREATGFAIGGVPPVGHSTSPLTIIDSDLLNFEHVWAAAGTPNAVFRIDSKRLVELTGGLLIDIKAEPNSS